MSNARTKTAPSRLRAHWHPSLITEPGALWALWGPGTPTHWIASHSASDDWPLRGRRPGGACGLTGRLGPIVVGTQTDHWGSCGRIQALSFLHFLELCLFSSTIMPPCPHVYSDKYSLPVDSRHHYFQKSRAEKENKNTLKCRGPLTLQRAFSNVLMGVSPLNSLSHYHTVLYMT